MFTVSDNLNETPSTKTVRFNEKLDAIPGQFVMVWVPGVDEFPMSVSYAGERCGITYQIVGEGTRSLADKTKGDRIGIRGPYGKGFSIQGKKVLAVAGGLGIAPLAPFIEEAVRHKVSIDLILGAKSASELLFESRSFLAGAKVQISTDDGSKGFKGLATELAHAVLENISYDAIYACGPERMISGLLGMANNKGIPVQASLERFMKCGIGICDSCAIDGKRVCKDGPVFSGTELRALVDLGKTKLDPSGRKIPI